MQQQQQQYSQERLQAARQAQEVVQCAKGDLSEQQDTRGAIQLKQNWLELWLEKRLEIVLCCAEKQCASSCRRGSNLSHRFSAQQSTLQKFTQSLTAHLNLEA